MYDHYQEQTAGQSIAILIACLIFWLIIFFIVKRMVNKKIVSQKKINNPKAEFNNKLFDELQFTYHIKETSTTLELNSSKFDDLITSGKIIIEIQSVGTDKKITMTYSRKLKGIGFIIILFSIMLCYVGVIIPYLIMQDTKKKTLKEMDNIFYIANSIQ